MLDFMDTYNYNNIHHRYDKHTNHKDSSRYTKHITKKVIMINCFSVLENIMTELSLRMNKNLC